MEKYKNIWSDKTLLLVEDDNVSQMLIEETLSITGIHIMVCASSKEAYNSINYTPHVDLVLLDILLPDENGYIVARYLRDLYPHLPIIAQTAYAMAHDKEKCIAAGCNDYITKPIKPANLINIMLKYLKP